MASLARQPAGGQRTDVHLPRKPVVCLKDVCHEIEDGAGDGSPKNLCLGMELEVAVMVGGDKEMKDRYKDMDYDNNNNPEESSNKDPIDGQTGKD